MMSIQLAYIWFWLKYVLYIKTIATKVGGETSTVFKCSLSQSHTYMCQYAFRVSLLWPSVQWWGLNQWVRLFPRAEPINIYMCIYMRGTYQFKAAVLQMLKK